MGEPYLGGALPVLATPFTRADAVDLPSLRRLADYAVAAGADGVVYPGVASEVDTLNRDERAGAFAAVCEAIAGRVPVIVGASAPDAAEAARQARAGEERGAAAAMVMAPAAAGCDAGSLTRFFSDVARSTSLPPGAPERTASGRCRPARRHHPRSRLGSAGNSPCQGGDAALRPADHGVAESRARTPPWRLRRCGADATSWTSSAAAPGAPCRQWS